MQQKDIGLRFTAIMDHETNCAWYSLYEYDSVEDLRKELHSEGYRLPANDAPIADCELRGVPIYVDSFMDIVKLLGIEHGKE